MLCYESWPELQQRYAVNEEKIGTEVKLPRKIEMGARECNSYGQWQFKRTQIHEVHAWVSRCRVRAGGLIRMVIRDTNEGRKKTPINVLPRSNSISGLTVLTVGSTTRKTRDACNSEK